MGKRLDTSLAEMPDVELIRERSKDVGAELTVRQDRSGALVFDSHGELAYDTELELEDGRVLTVKEALEKLPAGGKLRCQAPFRDSSSYAAALRRGADGRPCVYDSGTNTTYWLKNDEWTAQDFEDLDAKQADQGTAAAPAASATPTAKTPKFQFVSDKAYRRRPPPRWIVKGIIPDAELVALIGQPGSGKSFLAIDMAAAITRGVNWRGRRVRKGRSGYIAAEGAGSLRNRFEAYAQHHGIEGEIGVQILAEAPNFMQADDVREVILAAQTLGRLDVIFVDTFAQVTPGANENSGEDMGRAIGHCKELRKHTGATVVLVHHVGKDESKGARGWSGIKGAVDAEITVSADQFGRKAVISKMKDGPAGFELPFRLKAVTIGEDEDGDPIESCVVEHLEGEQAKARQIPRGKNERLVWDKLHALIDLGGDGVPVVALIEHAKQELPYDPTKKKGDRRRELVLQAIRSLQDSKFIRSEDNVIKVNS